jgi:hypothetical protein
MIDISKAGLNLRGVLIRGKAILIEGKEALRIIHLIHLKYVKQDALLDPSVAAYLSSGDDVTVKVSMDHVVSWNLADSKAGQALSASGWFCPFDG